MPRKTPSAGSLPPEGLDEKQSMTSGHDKTKATKKEGAAKGHGDHNLKDYFV
jgi:hypothetical protein